jgi:hypothetical protein
MATDLQSLLAQFSMQPSEDERRKAANLALMRMGMGVLAANQPSRLPTNPLGILAQGGMQGLDQYQTTLKDEVAMRRGNAATAMQAMQIKKEMEKADALKNLFGMSKPQPLGPQAMAMGAEQGDIGPTVGNAARLEALQQNPMASQYTPVPLDKLAGAAAAGVDIKPFLSLNDAARPDVLNIDMGDKIRLLDKKTLRVLGEVPKGAAPGSKPFEASDMTPEAFREFDIRRRQAGASQVVNNVNAFTPASEAAQTEFMKGMRASYDTLKTAGTVLDNIEKAKALIPSAKGFMGPGGETLLEAAKFLNNRMGMSIDTAGVKDAEELRSRVFFQIMENLKKMDAQPSQMQQVMMRDALGKLGTDPNALGAVLDAYGDVVKGKVDQHNTEAKSAIERGVKFPYDPLINLGRPGGGANFDLKTMPPAHQHKGRVVEGSDGKKYKSDGMRWVAQ